MSEVKRLFFGLELNGPARSAVQAAAQALRFSRGRLHDADNYHLTLVFLGMTEAAALPALARLARLAHPPADFSLTLSGRLGTFKNGTVVWAGVRDSAPLARTQARLQLILQENGFVRAPDAPFAPHITVARNVHGPADEADQPAVAQVTFPVRGITLFESLRVNDRLVYRPLFRTGDGAAS